MTSSDKPQFNYETARIVGERLSNLFKDLPKEEVMAAIEEFIDDYTDSVFGLQVIDALRSVKFPDRELPRQTIQTLARGRGVLISTYGFNVKTDHDCKCGRAFIVLDERNEKDIRSLDEG